MCRRLKTCAPYAECKPTGREAAGAPHGTWRQLFVRPTPHGVGLLRQLPMPDGYSELRTFFFGEVVLSVLARAAKARLVGSSDAA